MTRYSTHFFLDSRGSDSLNWRDTPSKSFPSPPMFHGPLPTHHPPYQQQQQFSQKEYFPDHIEQALFLHERMSGNLICCNCINSK